MTPEQLQEAVLRMRSKTRSRLLKLLELQGTFDLEDAVDLLHDATTTGDTVRGHIKRWASIGLLDRAATSFRWTPEGIEAVESLRWTAITVDAFELADLLG